MRNLRSGVRASAIVFIVFFASAAIAACGGESDSNSGGMDAATDDHATLDGSTGNAADGSTPDATSSLALSDSSTTSADADSGSTTVSSSALGQWVWKEEREKAANGSYDVKRTITEDDLVWKVGPSGWPGCPAGISCLHYGNWVFQANAAGRYHVMNRVTTGSDFQNFGSFTDANGLLTLKREQEYSCAHPLADTTKYPKPGTLYARYKRMGDDLWLTPFAANDPGAEPAKYTVYRPTTAADIARYDLKFCGIGRDGATKCHCLCPSRQVLSDYGCTT